MSDDDLGWAVVEIKGFRRLVVRLPHRGAMTTDPRADAITEAELQRNVIELARWQGWMVHHCRPSVNRSGDWSTHIQGDAGFPDLCMVHKATGRVVFAELKGERGKATTAQTNWLSALMTTSALVGWQDVQVREWRPTQWLDGTIQRVLTVTSTVEAAR